jgi:hypothetical protein
VPDTPASDPPPVTLRFNDAVGLFIHYAEADFAAEDLRGCLLEDKVEFSLNPPEAAHLVQAGQAVFVFGRKHPRVVAEALELVGEEVLIAPEVVMPEDLYQPPVNQLLALGEPELDDQREYAALGLTTNEVPTLIRLATDEQLHGGPQESPVVWAPVHAWRALAQLRAEEAIPPLIELLRRADDAWDDWVSNDLPKVLSEFGAVALAPLTTYLADAAHGEWARVAAANAIGRIGETHTELRADCVMRLCAQLDHFAEQSETFNAFLISSLWDLHAVEAMPAIKRAFASGRVDESVQGDVEDVEIEFGLKSKREHPPKPNSLTIMGEEFRERWQAAGLRLPDAADDFPELDSGPVIDLPPAPYIAPPKVGRNDPCPCGSGKKYKKCCGK